MSEGELQPVNRALAAIRAGDVLGATTLLKALVDRRGSLKQKHDGTQIVHAIVKEFENMLGVSTPYALTSAEFFISHAIDCLKNVYGENHMALGDLMTSVSAIKASSNITDAIEWGGKALLSRITSHGYVHAKTGDAHYNMGVLFRLNFEFKSSLKQLHVCRSIRCTLNGESSLLVADVDFHLGQTEKLLGHHPEALVCFYLCARTRFSLLGPSDDSTRAALQLLTKQYDTLKADKFLIGAQLKDMIKEHYGSNTAVDLAISSKYSSVQDNWLITHLTLRSEISQLMTSLDRDNHIESFESIIGLLLSAPKWTSCLKHAPTLTPVNISGRIKSISLIAQKNKRTSPPPPPPPPPPSSSSVRTTSLHPVINTPPYVNIVRTKESLKGGRAILPANTRKLPTRKVFTIETIDEILQHVPTPTAPISFNSKTHSIILSEKNPPLQTRKHEHMDLVASSTIEQKEMLLEGKEKVLCAINSLRLRLISCSKSTCTFLCVCKEEELLSDETIECIFTAKEKELMEIVKSKQRLQGSLNEVERAQLRENITRKTTEIQDAYAKIKTELIRVRSGVKGIKKSVLNSISKSMFGPLPMSRPIQLTIDMIFVLFTTNGVIMSRENMRRIMDREDFLSLIVSVDPSTMSKQQFNILQSKYLSNNKELNLQVITKASDACGYLFQLIVTYVNFYVLARREKEIKKMEEKCRTLISTSEDFKRDELTQLLTEKYDVLSNVVEVLKKEIRLLKLADTRLGNQKKEEENYNRISITEGGSKHLISLQDPKNFDTDSKISLPVLTGYLPKFVKLESSPLVTMKRVSSTDVLDMISPRIHALGMMAHFMALGTPNLLLPISIPTSKSKKNNSSRIIPEPPDLPTCWPPNFAYQTDTMLLPKSDSSDTINHENSQKTKNLYWEPIMDIDATLWAEDVSSLIPSVDELFDDIRDAFTAVTAPIKALKVISSPGSLRSKLLLDPQRAQSIGIMLAKFGKRSPEDITKAIAAMEFTAMGASEINSIRNLMPQPEEIEAVREADKNIKLGLPEKYILSMSLVPNLQQRLDAFLLSLTYEEIIKGIRNKCDSLIAALSQTKGSMRFKCILHVCLRGGNVLNSNSKQVVVSKGFKISSFSKLLVTKAKDGSTFLDYVIAKLCVRCPDILEIKEDFDNLEGAKQISLSSMAQDMKNLKIGLNTLNKLKDTLEVSGQDVEVQTKVAKLVTSVSSDLMKCTDLHQEAVEEFYGMCEYIGEPKDIGTVETLISQLSSVVAAIETSVQTCALKQFKKSRELKNVPAGNPPR